MDDRYEIEMDDLAIGLTRPVTKLGVPFMPFFMSIMVCFFGWMFYQAVSGGGSISSAMVFLMIWLICYSLMLFITSKDIFGLSIFWVNIQYFQPLCSRENWNNTDSYQP